MCGFEKILHNEKGGSCKNLMFDYKVEFGANPIEFENLFMEIIVMGGAVKITVTYLLIF